MKFSPVYAVAGSVASILARPGWTNALGCYNYETDYFGYDIQKIFEGPATESAQQCQEACQRNNLCAHWTYVADRKQCYLKDSNAPRSAVPNPLAISGPRFCFQSERCFEKGVDYYGNDLGKVEDGSVDTPEACQQLCRRTVGCSYWTHIQRRNNCYLKTDLAPQHKVVNPEAVSGPRVCSSVQEPTCHERDVDYVGHDIESTGDNRVGSPDECQILCASYPHCHYWTWISSLKNCYLKTKNASAGRTHVPGCISGPRTCPGQIQPEPAPEPAPPVPAPTPQLPPRTPSPGGKPCYDFGIMYKGADLENHIYVLSHEDCQQRCEKHPQCLYFTHFTKEKRCALKSAKGQSLVHQDAVSGGKSCRRSSVSECVKDDVEIFGRDIATAVLDTPQQCKKLCQVNVLCASYTYNRATKLCTQRQHEGPALGVISGHRACQAQKGVSQGGAGALKRDCFDEGFEYTGPGVGIQEQVGSPEECQQTCQRDFLCWAFTYSKSERKCLLQGWAGTKVSQPAAVSGRKYCGSTITPVPHQQCILGDYELYGKDLSAIVADSPQTCHKICRDNPLCAVWAFKVEPKLCYQRRREAYSVRMASGYKHCSRSRL